MQVGLTRSVVNVPDQDAQTRLERTFSAPLFGRSESSELLPAGGKVLYSYRNNVIWFASVESFNRLEVLGGDVPSGSVWLVDSEGDYVKVADLDADGAAQWDWTDAAASYADSRDLGFSNGDYGPGRFRGFIYFPLDSDEPVPVQTLSLIHI